MRARERTKSRQEIFNAMKVIPHLNKEYHWNDVGKNVCALQIENIVRMMWQWKLQDSDSTVGIFYSVCILLSLIFPNGFCTSPPKSSEHHIHIAFAGISTGEWKMKKEHECGNK